jgi:hypothetical protein
MAARVRREAGTDPAKQVACAFTLALGRAPDPGEGQAAALVRAQGLASLCRVLMNTNEFLYY